jgi:hypothetical protein
MPPVNVAVHEPAPVEAPPVEAIGGCPAGSGAVDSGAVGPGASVVDPAVATDELGIAVAPGSDAGGDVGASGAPGSDSIESAGAVTGSSEPHAAVPIDASDSTRAVLAGRQRLHRTSSFVIAPSDARRCVRRIRGRY